ncbi:MAG: B12-binding domain-containing radical SAM protein [Candidatus Sumerlaeaceae bacterium]|nr:B12-binding domain-containing radical SAM protein [Candidatus Sumerlaeaceae bacterium]
MAKRVFLMNPPSELYRRDDRCQSKVEDQTVRVVFPPIELGVMASMARELGAEVALKDYPTVGADGAAYLRDVREFEPDLILLNTTAHTVRQDLAAFTMAREFFPNVRTVVKGEAVAVNADKTLAEFPQLDVILDGEPEETFKELLTDKPLSEIRGIVWRDSEGVVHHNPERPLIEPLDSLPLPAYDLFEKHLYRSPENSRIITAIYAQRGCPAKCIYCPAGSMFGYSVRERSIEHVMKEIELSVEKYGIRDFLFHGDTFTLHKKWLIELCKAIIDRKLNIRWGCNSRVDTIDDERADWMRRAGCWVVAFGFEHGSQMMLDNMKKGAKAERAFSAVEVCRRNKLKIHGFFVIGLPWETEETLEENFQFVRKLNPDFFDFNIAYPLPGTEYHDIVVRDGLFETPDPTKGGYAQGACRTYALTSAQLTAWRRKALLRMYSRPGYILRTLKNAAANGNTRHYAKAAIQRLSSLLSPA